MHQSVDPFAFQAKQNRKYMTVGIALLVVALVIGLLGSGVLGLGLRVGSPVTRALQATQGAVTQAKTDFPTPVTQAAAVQVPVTEDPNLAKKMPQHNLDWLKHLERIENKRRDMANKELAAVLTQLTMLQGVGATEEVMKGLLNDGDVESKTPSDEIGEQASKEKAEWRELIDDFDSLPPPPDCVPIRNAYAQCIGETKAMLGEVIDSIRGAGDDPKRAITNLMKLKGKSSDRIDVAAKQTDDLVQDICDEYAVRKWFKVNSDVGGGLGGVLGGLENAIGK